MRIVAWVAILVVSSSVFGSAPVSAQPAPGVPPGPGQPPSATLERAIKLYDKADYLSSSIELAKVTSGLTGDTPPNVQRAEQYYGRTLFHLKLYIPAMGAFSKVVQAGPEHAYWLPTLKWLAGIVQAVPDFGTRGQMRPYRGELDNLRGFNAKALHVIYFGIGAELAETGEESAAEALLAKIPPGAVTFGRAQLALAMIRFRRMDGEGGVAAALAAARDPAVAEEAARMIADWTRKIGQGGRAREALQTLRKAAPSAHLELSRIELEEKQVIDGLAELDVGAFDAVILGTVCTGGWRDHAMPHVAATVREARALVDELLVHDDSAERYAAVMKLAARTEVAAGVAIRLAVFDPSVRAALDWIAEIKRELDLLSRTDKAWQTTAVAAEALQELAIHESLAISDAGKMLQSRLRRFREQLDSIGAAVRRPAATAVAIGPKAAPGAGLIVNDAICSATLGTATTPSPSGVALAGPTPIGAGPGRGCAGCASHGDAPPALVALLAAVLLAPWRRRGRRRAATASCGRSGRCW